MPYAELLELFGLHSLSARRQAAALVYLHQLVRGALDDESVLARLNFVVPRPNSRPRPLFSSRFANTNLGDYAPLNLVIMLHNSILSHEHDIFFMTKKQLHRTVLYIVSRRI